MGEAIQLAKFIEELRGELSAAITAGADATYRFRAKAIEVELQVAAEHKHDGSGKLAFKLFGVGVEGGGGLSQARSDLQKIKLLLDLVDAEGRSPLISAPSSGQDA